MTSLTPPSPTLAWRGESALLSSGFIPAPGRWLGSARVVVSRKLLRLKQVDLAKVPPADRWSAARAQALAWAPFERSTYRICVRADNALLVAWDEAWATEQLTAAGLKPAKLELLPEALLQTPPAADAVRLVKTTEGVEGQYWRNAWLQASRWWPERPAEREWANFLHGARVPEGLWGQPVVAEPAAPSRPRLWIKSRSIEAAEQQAVRAERWLLAGVGLVLVVMTGWQARADWELRQQALADQQQRDELLQAAAPVVKAREAALKALVQANALTRRVAAVQPLDVLGHLAAVLPKQGVLLKELDLDNGRLRVVLEPAATVSRAALVTALQSGGWFTDVTEVQESVQRGWVGFAMTLPRLAPPVVGLAATAASAASAPGVGQAVPAQPARGLPK